MADLYIAIYKSDGQEDQVGTRDGKILVAGADEWGSVASQLVKIDPRSVDDNLTAQFVDLLEDLRK